jgi:medium-chain acyl-[acyl-carrier-protein] hydrolase
MRAFRPGSRLRLFCLPYAGGSAGAYYSWLDAFADDIEVCPVELPGRASRLRDPLIDDFDTLLAALHTAIAPRVDRPYALFGYSMGSLLAFELARKFRQTGLPLPRRLFVAARGAPHISHGGPQLSSLGDDEFLREVQRRYRAIPDVLLADAEMRAMILRVMRSDLSVVESYRYRAQAPLACPIIALGGRADPAANERALQSWREQTASGFMLRMFDGDHFFLEPRRAELLQLVRGALLARRRSYEELDQI